MLYQSLRKFAMEAISQPKVLSITQPPAYTLASLRTFPSLEPHSFIPIPASFFCSPLRKDFLWSSVVYEADKARVGSGNVPTKGDKPFSNRKLRPQKGTGRARVGDANSPHRYNSLKAHGNKAPHDWSTELPRKIYNRGYQAALLEQYNKGKLYVVGPNNIEPSNEFDDSILDFRYDFEDATEQFVKAHNLQRLNLLFITNDERPNLIKSTAYIGKLASVLVKEAVEVRDILKANRVFIDMNALQWMISKFSVDPLPSDTRKIVSEH